MVNMNVNKAQIGQKNKQTKKAQHKGIHKGSPLRDSSPKNEIFLLSCAWTTTTTTTTEESHASVEQHDDDRTFSF